MTPTLLSRPAAPSGNANACITPRMVVVQSGARDAYQVALALAEAGLLERLVTDLFWPADRAWARTLAGHLPRGLQAMARQRSEPGLPSSAVHLQAINGGLTLVLDKLRCVPTKLRRGMMRHADAALGRTAGRLANRRNAGLLSYSYYGFDAFTEYAGRGMLFQLHPHPASMRRLLLDELAAHPDCAASLQQEWELALPEADFQHLVRETSMAQSFLAASSFTRSTLVENGTPAEAVHVVPYGVDFLRFAPDRSRRSLTGGKLRLLFVGRINQRKGIKYLLEAMRLVDSDQVELTVCGRVVDDLELFRPFADRIQIRPDVSAEELVAAYQAADLFVFPSVAEGFGQVLLESLACGLPILSTTHTAAPDLIESGRQGFVVEPRQPEQLADRIAWSLTHRAELFAMREEARLLAEQFTWQRFREGVVQAVRQSFTDGRATLPPLSQPTGRAHHAL
jgi:glycosyltransferase involved in cell wall biosynthesis